MSSELDLLLLAGVGSLSPLPLPLEQGVISMGLLGLFSLISCGLLFSYITYRVIEPRRSPDDGLILELRDEAVDMPDLSRGANQRHLSYDMARMSNMSKSALPSSEARLREEEAAKRPESNSFLTLIHNLLIADMFQSFAFVLSLNWWRYDGILVPSSTCAAQAFFISLGGVSISTFVMGISLNTYLTIVWGLKLSRRAVLSVVAIGWLFSFVLAL